MNAKEALEAMCDRCHKEKQAQPSKGDFPHKECPFRHISNDYCEEYETVRKALEVMERQDEILRILKKYPGWAGSFGLVRFMANYWRKYNVTVDELMLQAQDFPFSVEEFNAIVKWLEE